MTNTTKSNKGSNQKNASLYATPLELEVLAAIKNDQYQSSGSGLDPVWVWSPVDGSHRRAGAISTLERKGFIKLGQCEPGPKGKVVWITAKGMKSLNSGGGLR